MPEEVQKHSYANGDLHTMYIGEVLDVVTND
jgi:hypothetical protein